MSSASAAKTSVHQPWPGVIAAYRDRLPVGADWVPVTLLEGGTPLIAAPRLSAKTGCTVHLKVEGAQSHRLLQGPRHDDGRH